MSITITTPTVRGKKLDLWVDLAGIEEGGELRCSSVKTFLAYLFSDSTRSAAASCRRTGVGLNLRLTGPVCDDRIPLVLRYELAKEEWEAIPGFVRRRALEKLARLRTGTGFDDPEKAIRETFGGAS